MEVEDLISNKKRPAEILWGRRLNHKREKL
jgi:hypothetical protein